MLRDGRWALDWACCQECGTTERRHWAKGLCKRCYGKSQNECIDCGMGISSVSTRCGSCARKAVWKRGVYDGHSEAMKAAWGRGVFDDRTTEEYRRKLSETQRAAWERGDMDGVFDSDACRRKHSGATKEAWERGDYDGLSGALKAAWVRGDFDGVFQSPTSIELQVAAALDIMGIEHETQYRPEGYSRIFDEFVLPKTLIEIQGDYWHGDNFPEHQERDAEKAQWAIENGFEFVEIWEHEIKELGAETIITHLFGGNDGTRRE